jgi:cyclopropane fatty-acyl-phospholipid synthase-like methyltransferase
VLTRVLPARGRVLEIASGTGQHVVHFAARLPSLTFMPTDMEPAHREAIAQRIAAAGLANLEPPRDLDVLREPWPVDDVAAIVCINMIHIAPWEATPALVAGAARRLPEGGVLVLYGPYLREGRHTAPSNEAFDQSLRQRNPAWGVRDLETVQQLCGQHGLALEEIAQLPANNLCVVFRRR